MLWGEERQPLWQVEAHEGFGVHGLAWAGDDLVVSGGGDNTVVFWDAESGLRNGEALRGHQTPLSGVAVSPDGETLATISRDAVFLWDVETRRPLGKVNGTGRPLANVAWKPGKDGPPALVSGFEERSVIRWDVDLDSWRRRACRRVNRDMTVEEWEWFLGYTGPAEPTCTSLLEAQD